MDIRSALFCSLLAIGTIAHAEGFYVLGSVGQSSTHLKDISQDDIDTWTTDNYQSSVASSSIDDTDTGYKLQLGYQFNKNFALEGGYVDLGKVEYSATMSNTSKVKLDYDNKGWNINGVLTLPVNAGVSVIGKIGLMSAETELSGTDLKSDTVTKTTPIFGIGVAWNFWEHVSVRAEWERFFNLNEKDIKYDNETYTDPDTGDVIVIDEWMTKANSRMDVDLFSIGLSYQF